MGRQGANSTEPARSRSQGFTLLEIMVAMLLLSVIVTFSVSLLFTNIRSWDSLVSDSEASLDETLINDRLVQMISHLIPLVWQAGGDRRLAFSGEPDRLQFVSQAPQQYRSGGLFEYLLVQEFDSDNRANLVLYYAPYYPGQTGFRLPQEGVRRPLYTDTGGIRFSYLGVQEPGRPADWVEQWESDSADYPLALSLLFTGNQEGEGAASFTIPRLIDKLEPIK